MAGTRAGGLKARDHNLTNYGADFYQRIGRKGGKLGKTGGFYHMKEHNPEKLRQVSIKGGTKSRRTKKVPSVPFGQVIVEKPPTYTPGGYYSGIGNSVFPPTDTSEKKSWWSRLWTR